ncbi:MAG: DUF4340 domain-containing protein [Elainellaceae cyanobacterium]
MKLSRSTVVLLAIALVLGAAVVLFERRPDESDDGPQPLFSFEEGDVQAVTIDTSEETLAFERGEDGAWQMTEPEAQPASEASVVYLLNLLAAGESSRRLPAIPSEAADFGFDNPLATIDITLDEAQTHQLVLGNYNFSNQFVYALVDPLAEAASDGESGNGKSDNGGSGAEAAGDNETSGDNETDTEASAAELLVHLVSTDFDTAVSRPVEDWQDAVPSPEASPEAPPSEGAEAPDAAVDETADETDSDADSPAP